MKKLLLFVSFALFSLNSNAKWFYIATDIIEPKCPRTEEDGSMFKNDSIWVTFGANEYYCGVYIMNNTDKRIYVEWSNFRWDGRPIVFDTDNRLFMNNKKEDEVVMPGEWLDKNVIQKNLVGDSWITPWLSRKYIKKGGEQTAKIIVPIRYANGDVKDYVFVIKAYNGDLNK